MTIHLAVPASQVAAVRSEIYAFVASRESEADVQDCGIFITVHSANDVCHYDLDFANPDETDAFLTFFLRFAPTSARGCAITAC